MIVLVKDFWNLKSPKLIMIFWHHNMNIFGTLLRNQGVILPLRKKKKSLNPDQDQDPKKDLANRKSKKIIFYKK